MFLPSIPLSSLSIYWQGNSRSKFYSLGHCRTLTTETERQQSHHATKTVNQLQNSFQYQLHLNTFPCLPFGCLRHFFPIKNCKGNNETIPCYGAKEAVQLCRLRTNRLPLTIYRDFYLLSIMHVRQEFDTLWVFVTFSSSLKVVVMHIAQAGQEIVEVAACFLERQSRGCLSLALLSLTGESVRDTVT